MKTIKPFLLNLVLVWSIILIYRTTNYYLNFLRQDTQQTLLAIATIYTIIGFIYYSLFPKKQTKGTIILNIIIKTIQKIYKYFTKPLVFTENITKTEKTILLFVLVKAFFLPIMLNFFLGNLNVIKNQISTLSTTLSITTFNLSLFPIIMSLIFIIDTLYFSFGYTTEAKFLKNKIRSVEPTLLGWAVALACYPPFNTLFTKYTNWYADIYIALPSTIFNFIIKLLIITLFLIYLSATISLGTKCSNLTNRGIVTKGTYSIIRHPAYISKVLVWWLVILPIISWYAFLSMSTWSFIYHLRTLTEERHLSQDPDYIKYKQKVKYKYIPGIY